VTSQHLLPLACNRKRPAPPPAGLFFCLLKSDTDEENRFFASSKALN
jgi:hypothetical protein